MQEEDERQKRQEQLLSIVERASKKWTCVGRAYIIRLRTPFCKSNMVSQTTVYRLLPNQQAITLVVKIGTVQEETEQLLQTITCNAFSNPMKQCHKLDELKGSEFYDINLFLIGYLTKNTEPSQLQLRLLKQFKVELFYNYFIYKKVIMLSVQANISKPL